MAKIEVGRTYKVKGSSVREAHVMHALRDLDVFVVSHDRGPVLPHNAEGKRLDWATLEPVEDSLFYDLVLPKEKLVWWANVYRDFDLAAPGRLHRTRADADRMAKPTRVACVRVECEEGDGL